MAKLKNKDNILLLVALLVVIAVLFRGGPGLLSFITTCQNYEPDSYAEWSAYTNNTNATMADLSPLTFVEGNNTLTYPRKLLSSDDFSLIVIGVTGYDCQGLLDKIIGSSNITINVEISNHMIKIVNERYYWCSNNEALLLSTDEITSVSGYYATFEVCTKKELNTSANNPEYFVVEKTPPMLLPEETTVTTTNSKNVLMLLVGGLTTLNISLILMLLVGGIIVYFVYEAGPDKGVFRGRKRR